MRLGLVPSLVFAQQQLFLAPAPYSELAAQSAAAQFAPHAKPYPPLPAPALESGSFPQYAVPFVEPRAEGPEDTCSPERRQVSGLRCYCPPAQPWLWRRTLAHRDRAWYLCEN